MQARNRLRLLALTVVTVLYLLIPAGSALASFDIHGWRWANDDGEDPTCRGSLSTAIDVHGLGTGNYSPILRLRLVWYHNETAVSSGTGFTLNYDTDVNFASPVEIGAPGTTTEKFRFRDNSYATHGNDVSSRETCTDESPGGHSVRPGKHVERKSTSSWSFDIKRYYEMDFSIEYIGNETDTYYFRPEWTGTQFTPASGHSQVSINTETNPTISALTTDKGSYPDPGEIVNVDGTLLNPTSQTYSGTSVEYVIFIDNGPADGVPSSGESYIYCAGAWSGSDCTDSTYGSWSAGNTTRVSSSVTVNNASSATDSWTIKNNGFPDNTTYTIYATWKNSGSTTVDTRTTTFSSVPTLGVWLSLLAAAVLLTLAVRRGEVRLRGASP